MSSAWVNTKVRQGDPTPNSNNNGNNGKSGPIAVHNGRSPLSGPPGSVAAAAAGGGGQQPGGHGRSGSAPPGHIHSNGSGATASGRHSAEEAKRKGGGEAPHHMHRLDNAVIDGWIDNVSRATAAVGRGGLNPHGNIF
jgi:hypothetical protein